MTIGLTADTYKRLLALASRLQVQRGKKVSMNEVVSELIEERENNSELIPGSN